MKKLLTNNILIRNKAITYTVLLIIVVTTLFLKKENLNSMSIILLIVFWLSDLEKNITAILKDKYLFIMIIFFSLSLYGIIISENIQYAIKLAQRALPFLAFPLIFHALKEVKINRKYIKLGFVIATVLAIIYCQINNLLYWRWVNSFSTNDFSFLQYFTHSWFTYSIVTKYIDLQPSFFSLFILTSTAFILDYLIFDDKRKKKEIIIGAAIIVFFTIFMIQLSSKIGIVVYALLLGYYFFKLKIKNYCKAIIIVVSGAVFVILLMNSRFLDRITELQSMFEEKKDEGDNSVNVKKIRVVAFNAFISQEPKDIILGQGTGDAQKYLDTYYDQNIINASAEVKKQWKVKGLHYHNQFIQNFGETGVFGFVVLILMLLLSLKKAYKSKYRLHYLFILMCFLFFLSDSVLMRHKGLVFFVFFNSFFLIKNTAKK